MMEERRGLIEQLNIEADFNQRIRQLSTADPQRWPQLKASDERILEMLGRLPFVGYHRNGVGYARTDNGRGLLKYKHKQWRATVKPDPRIRRNRTEGDVA